MLYDNSSNKFERRVFMNQIERIELMERNLNDAIKAISDLQDALNHYIDTSKQIEEVSAYYGSKEWFQDFEDDRKHKIPKDLNRGVLSEDGIHNMLIDNFELKQKIRSMQIKDKMDE